VQRAPAGGGASGGRGGDTAIGCGDAAHSVGPVSLRQHGRTGGAERGRGRRSPQRPDAAAASSPTCLAGVQHDGGDNPVAMPPPPPLLPSAPEAGFADCGVGGGARAPPPLRMVHALCDRSACSGAGDAKAAAAAAGGGRGRGRGFEPKKTGAAAWRACAGHGHGLF
jgi:hypothetical protein